VNSARVRGATSASISTRAQPTAGKPPEGDALQRLLPWNHDPNNTTASPDTDPPKITDTG